MEYFVTYQNDKGEERCQRFYSIEGLFEWMQKTKNDSGAPRNLCIYKGNCILDWS